MKILKIFGIVVGIHFFALVLIFATPGCSSTTKPAPAPTDTVATAEAPPTMKIPNLSGSTRGSTSESSSAGSPPVSFNPDAPATATSSSSSTGGVRFTPTRPGTPVAGALVTEPVVDVTPATTYVVKTGDSLWTIAKKNHLTVAELTAANSLPSNVNLKPGQKLLIPGKPASTSTAAMGKGETTVPAKAETATTPASAGTRSADSVKHVVKSGETLGGIARIYGVKQGEIAVANNITDPAKIRPGMELIIPGWQTPAGKSGKSSKSGSSSSNSKTGDTKSASKADKSAPAATEAPAPAPAAPPPIPIIRLDDPPITPAPKP